MRRRRIEAGGRRRRPWQRATQSEVRAVDGVHRGQITVGSPYRCAERRGSQPSTTMVAASRGTLRNSRKEGFGIYARPMASATGGNGVTICRMARYADVCQRRRLRG